LALEVVAPGMIWLFVIVLSYFIFGIVALVDKYLVGGPIPHPKVYAFYVGILGFMAMVLIPWVGFFIPQPWIIILAFLAGAIRLFALFGFYSGLRLFETSRIVPAMGGFLPLSTLGLSWLLTGQRIPFSLNEVLAFVLLVLGSILITLEKEKLVTLVSLGIAFLAAFLFGLSFVLSKLVYLELPFWPGLIWLTLGGGFTALFLLFSKEVRRELFQRRVSFKFKTVRIFFMNIIMGAGASVLQNWAIFLVPLGWLAFINALEGTKYAFLLIFVIAISLIWPAWAKRVGLKEEISRTILIQKISAILLIGGGMILLAF